MEKQKTLVVDASVAVKWFVNEENSNKALELKESFLKRQIELIAPDFIILEILNALRYNKKKESELVRANKDLFELSINLKRLNDLLSAKAIENSIKYSITIYDALYVTLAQIHGTFLITSDKALYKIPNVIALEEI